MASLRSSSPRTRSSTSSATTTTTSRRPTSPRRDTYIEKDSTINDEIDRMRHAATHSLHDPQRRASWSRPSPASTAWAPPEATTSMAAQVERGKRLTRDELPAATGRHPVRAQRPRLPPRHLPRPRRHRRGLPALRGGRAIRMSFFGDEVEAIQSSTRCGAQVLGETREGRSSSRSHYVTPESDRASRGGRHPRGAAASPHRAQEPGQARRGAAARAADHVRPRDDRADGLLLGHRELLAPPRRTEGGRDRRPA